MVSKTVLDMEIKTGRPLPDLAATYEIFSSGCEMNVTGSVIFIFFRTVCYSMIQSTTIFYMEIAVNQKKTFLMLLKWLKFMIL